MPRKTRPFAELRMQQLADPEIAAEYLNLAIAESMESFLKALRAVAQARQMAKVAKESGVQRETLYRSLSEEGNPTLDTLSSVLAAVGMGFRVEPEGSRSLSSPTTTKPANSAKANVNPTFLNTLGVTYYVGYRGTSEFVNDLYIRNVPRIDLEDNAARIPEAELVGLMGRRALLPSTQIPAGASI